MKKTIFLLSFLLSSVLHGHKVSSSKYIGPPCGGSCEEQVYDRPAISVFFNKELEKDVPKTIAFYLQDGVEILDFAGPLEVFFHAGYEVFTVSKDKRQIKSQGVLTIQPDYSIEEAPKADILAFFGGNASVAYKEERVIKWIHRHKNVQYYFSVCTGAFVLAEAGLLDGKAATTFHRSLSMLEENYPKVDVRKGVRFVDNGNVVTTAGVSAGIDGALHMVAKLQGLNTAKRIAYYMEYDNWIPGDGLLLTDDNPYENEEVRRSDFIGDYESSNGSELNLVFKEEEFIVFFGEAKYPIYHETGDIFSDVRNKPIYFERDDSGEVIGYRLKPRGKLFKKL